MPWACSPIRLQEDSDSQPGLDLPCPAQLSWLQSTVSPKTSTCSSVRATSFGKSHRLTRRRVRSRGVYRFFLRLVPRQGTQLSCHTHRTHPIGFHGQAGTGSVGITGVPSTLLGGIHPGNHTLHPSLPIFSGCARLLHVLWSCLALFSPGHLSSWAQELRALSQLGFSQTAHPVKWGIFSDPSCEMGNIFRKGPLLTWP